MFSKETQIKAVTMYLKGVSTKCKNNLALKNSAMILNWVINVKELDIYGIKYASRNKANYQYFFKTKVIKWRIEHKAVIMIVLRQKLKCKLKLILPEAEMSSSSYHATCKRAYFTAYIDVYIGVILSWNIDLHPTVEFVTKPLDELLNTTPKLIYRLTVHSDQGFQYQNCEYVSRLQNNHVFQGMSRKATCLDNTMAARFFHILKVLTAHNN